MSQRKLGSVVALVAMLFLLVGVPLLLVGLVGNPWPGRGRLEMRDELALVIGVLAVLAWLVWLRFVVAVVVEIRQQVDELRRPSPAAFAPPPPARHGVGSARSTTGCNRTDRAADRARRVSTAVAHASDRAPRASRPVVASPTAQPVPSEADHVTVVAGDTLFGLARSHLGDTERWREIFDLNRDRPQPDGGRLTSPSIIRPGWTLVLPGLPAGVPNSPAPFLASETITIGDGDDLWSLSHQRLQRAGADHDDAAVAGYVQSVVAANPDVVEDPDLIFPGERFDFPTIGTPPPVPRPRPAAATTRAGGRRESPAEIAVPAPERPAVAPLPAPAPTSTTAPTSPPVAPPDAAPADRRPGHHHRSVSAKPPCCPPACSPCWRRVAGRGSAPRPRARVPEPPAGSVAAERRLRTIDAGSDWQGSTSPSVPLPPHSSTRHRESPSCAPPPTGGSS